MMHFSRYNKPDKKVLTEYLLPIGIQIVLVAILILIHRSIVKLGFLIQPSEVVNGVVSSPTVGRLILLVINPFLIAAAIYLAIHFNKKNNELLTFVFANIAGIILWQLLGEDFWHFSIGGIHFLTFETIQSLPIVLLLISLLVFFALKKEKNWALWLTLIVFSYNWLGHFLSEGLYPLFASITNFTIWAISSTLVVCVPISLFGIYLGIYASKDIKGRYLSSILTFASIAILIMNIIHSS